jgi:hypothetical protein
MRSLPRLVLFAVTALAAARLAAETAPLAPATVTAQRPLSIEDFDAWRSLASPTLSRDGRWLAYSFMPQDGDGEVILRELATGREQRLLVGALPPPPIQPDEANPDAPPAPRTIRLAFTADAQHLVASTYPAKAALAAARKAKLAADAMPKGGLLHVQLATGAVTTITQVKSFQISTKAGAWLAYLKEAKPEEKKPDPKTDPASAIAPTPAANATNRTEEDDAAAPTRAGTGARTASANSTAKPEFGTDLVLLDLAAATPSERTFSDVLDYSLARDGRTLLTTLATKAGTTNGLYVFTPGAPSDKAPSALLAG